MPKPKNISIEGLEAPTFEARLGLLIKAAGGQNAAAELCGVNRNTLYLWAKSEGKMPLNAALKLTEAAGVSVYWLATGSDRRPGGAVFVAGRNRAPDPLETLDLARVPVLSVSAAAGAGAANDHPEIEDTILMPRAQLRAAGVAPQNAHYIKVKGDSMEPTIADGAIVLIDSQQRRFVAEAIYAISLDGDVRLKRLSRAVDGAILVLSDNPRYPPEKISAAETLKIEGRAVWAERRL